ncbi:hypothetical protein YSA_04068 [Pseudomonas putida ND6]|uniref:Uncharacterized protein n=1 Tax=Pseudomonas putida ND6 TaxID=231023 RepID=I3UTZ8_PSEPU|nr:hypothetical protein YSA_04068 [Pseudomonas putida ND6]
MRSPPWRAFGHLRQLRLPPCDMATGKNVSCQKDLMSLRWQGDRT